MPRTASPATRRAEDLTTARASFQRSLRGAGKSAKTILLYTEAVRLLQDFLHDNDMPQTVAGIRREHVEAFYDHILTTKGWKPSTANQLHRSLAQFWKWAISDDRIKASPQRAIQAPRIPREPARAIRPEEVAKLLKACRGKRFADIRDTAIISLFYASGARLAELTELTLDDLDLDNRLITVKGKGGHVRQAKFDAKTAHALDRYLSRREAWTTHANRYDRYANHKALWFGEQGPMTKWGITRVIRLRSQAAGVDGIHPHAFRHGHVHASLRNGAQLVHIQAQLGWQNGAMFQRYATAFAVERAHEAYDEFAPMNEVEK